MVYKMVNRVVIAHQYGKSEVTGDSGHGAANAGRDPIRACSKQILYVLERSKSHPDSDSIDNAIHSLIEIPVVSQEEPETEKFSGLFRNGGPEKCCRDSSAEVCYLGREKTE